MGFNAGAFAGALGTSALNTFTRLEENSRAAEKAQQDAEVHEAWRKEQQQQADLAANYGNTIGSADTTQRTAVPGTMGVGPDGPVAQMQDAPYTDAQKLADFKSKNAAAGIDPLKSLQISSAARSDKSAQKLADFQDWSVASQELLQKDPVEWARQNIGAYNKPSKGSLLDDGMTAEIVKGADGSSSFIQKNAKGAVVSSTPITPETANDAFQRIAFAKYQALDFKGGMELGIKKDRATYENMRDAAASNYYNGVGRQAGGGSKGSVKNFTVETVDDKGVKVKTPVLARVGTDKEGNPKVEAFTLDGKPITDSKIINQLGAPSGDENGPSSALGADVASARKRYETGAIDYKTYQQKSVTFCALTAQQLQIKLCQNLAVHFLAIRLRQLNLLKLQPNNLYPMALVFIKHVAELTSQCQELLLRLRHKLKLKLRLLKSISQRLDSTSSCHQKLLIPQ